MSAITKVAAVVLASGLLTGAGAGAAFAYDTTVDTGYVAVEEIVAAPVTLEEVEAAFAAFKTAQATALAAEKQAHSEYQVAEKAALDATKAVKGGDKKAAQDQVQALRAANQAALKALKATNQVAVDEAKAAYQVLADLYGAQNTVVEAPVVEVPVTDPAALPAA
jgi:hypothetical protein